MVLALRTSSAVFFAPHFLQKIGSMKFDGPRADAEFARNLLAGKSLDDFSQDEAFLGHGIQRNLGELGESSAPAKRRSPHPIERAFWGPKVFVVAAEKPLRQSPSYSRVEGLAPLEGVLAPFKDCLEVGKSFSQLR